MTPAPVRIELRLEPTADVWTATSDSFVALFGTDTLPTAWHAPVPARIVLADIQARNPRALVSVRAPSPPRALPDEIASPSLARLLDASNPERADLEADNATDNATPPPAGPSDDPPPPPPGRPGPLLYPPPPRLPRRPLPRQRR